MTMDPQAELTDDERQALASGHYDQVANQLETRLRPDLAGWVHEQIWAWNEAIDAYRRARRPVAVLRVALETGRPQDLDQALQDLNSASVDEVNRAVALLRKRRRMREAADLLAYHGDRDPVMRAQALRDAGDPLAAAEALADAGHAHEALALLQKHPPPTSGRSHALAARLAWDLGDAESAAHEAQVAAWEHHETPATTELLAKALVALGHDLAAQIVLRGQAGEDAFVAAVPGRYRVNGVGPPGFVGASYVGIDRVTLEEIEIHLLLAEHGDAIIDTSILNALERFAVAARSASRLAHPAIRPILRLDPRAGLMVLPRAEGPTLRSLIRAPGMLTMPSRARALVAFMLEGLQEGHRHGLVHGALLPSQISCDALGRPVLGPFGAYHLAGLTATRTGSLEELMVITAPEIRGTAAPTTASDVYAVGALFRALLLGHLDATPASQTSPELELAAAMTAVAPHDRPRVAEILHQLRTPVADVRTLRSQQDTWSPARRATDTVDPQHHEHEGTAIDVAESWSNEDLDALCNSCNPFMQPIIDRHDRHVVLASWPEGSQALGDAFDGWKELTPAEALTLESTAVQAAVRTRLRPESLVRLPCGTWMIALDDLLMR